MYLIPLTIFFLLFAYLTWRDLLLGIYLFAGLLPVYLIRFSLGPLPSTALEAMFGIIFVTWLMQAKPKKDDLIQFSKSIFFWPGALLVLASGVSVFWATDIAAALGIWKAYFVEPFLLYILLGDVLKKRKDWKKVFLALGFATIALTLLAIVQRVTGWWSPTWVWLQPETRRVTGLFTSPNALGLFVAPVVAIFLAPIITNINNKRRVATRVGARHSVPLVPAIAGVISILLAVSRGAMIGLLAAILFILFSCWSKKKTVVITFIGMLVLLAIPLTRTSVISLGTFQEASGQSRLFLYSGTWELLKEDPIKGVGLASFADRFEDVRPDGYTEELIYPHNLFLNFWTETGLLGLIAVFAIIVLVILSARGSFSDPIKVGLIAALITVMIHGLVDVPYFKNDLAMLTWILLSGLAALPQLDRDVEIRYRSRF